MVSEAPARPRASRSRLPALPDAEAVTRLLARQDLGEYAKYVHGFTPARHHQQWLERIQRLVTGEDGPRRVLFIAPPQHAKSFYLSLVFPCWYLGRHPDHSILFTTSSDRMAHQFGGSVRLTLEGSSRYAAVFPDPRCRPCPERGWSTEALYVQGAPAAEKDPSYQAVGFGASVLGARAHGLILDDPLTQAAAESQAEREAAVRYFDMTLSQRVRPDGWLLGIMTRWAEQDLAAHLTAQGWEVVAFPALGDYPWGRALWPEQFPEAALLAEQARIGGPIFQCLFNGDPTSLGGAIFRREWFTRAGLPEAFERDIRPALTRVQYVDLAFSERTSADYTAVVTVGLRPGDERLYVVGCWRDRIDEQRLDEALLAQIRLHWSALMGVEEGAYRQVAAVRDLVRRLQAAAHREGLPVAVIGVKVAGDKVLRARLPAARLQAGTLLFDREAPWYPDLVSECTSFPRGANDDQCLVRETVVSTPNGPQRLDAIRVGDVILGASGWVTVEAAACTGVRPVVVNGPLCGTAEHPVWTDRGWCALARVDDTMSVWIQSVTLPDAAGPSWPKDTAACTTRGSIRGGRSDQPSPSETSRGRYVPWTVVTSRASPKGGAASTLADGSGTGTLWPWWAQRVVRCAWRRESSTGSSFVGTRIADSRRIGATSSRPGSTSSVVSRHSTRRYGSTTVALFQRASWCITQTATRATTVSRIWNSLRLRSMSGATLRLGVLSVVPRSSGRTWSAFAVPLRRGTARLRDGHGIGPMPVPCGIAPVYNLTTSDGTYFANGILVHNCDALSGATQLAVESAALAAEDTAPATYSFAPPSRRQGGGPLAPSVEAAAGGGGGGGQAEELDDLQRDLFEPKFRRPPEQRNRWPFLTPEQQAQLERLLDAAARRGGDEDGEQGEEPS